MIDIVRETANNVIASYKAGELSFDELVSLIMLCGYYEAAGKVMGSIKMLLDQGLTGQEAHASVHQMLHAEAEVMGILPATPGDTNVH